MASFRKNEGILDPICNIHISVTIQVTWLNFGSFPYPYSMNLYANFHGFLKTWVSSPYYLSLFDVEFPDYNTKITDVENKLNDHNHDKCIDTSEFNTLATNFFNARFSDNANLITKTDFDAKLSSLNRKITQNKSKHLLVENELNKLKTFDSSYYNGKSYFEEDGTPNYLIFQPLNKYFKVITKEI